MPQPPLVLTCPGHSSLGRLARNLAERLQREGLAGCSGCPDDGERPLLALDGCARQCARRQLAERGLAPQLHLILSRYGVRKRRERHASDAELQMLFEELSYLLALQAKSSANGR